MRSVRLACGGNVCINGGSPRELEKDTQRFHREMSRYRSETLLLLSRVPLQQRPIILGR